MKSAVKKPPIMTKVQNVRVMKLAFFFSYSAFCCSIFCSGLWGFWKVQHHFISISSSGSRLTTAQFRLTNDVGGEAYL